MKKLLIIALLAMVLLPLLPAAESEQLEIRATVREDHGVIFPPDAFHLDRFFFETGGELIHKDGVQIDFTQEQMEIILIYYGNESEDADVVLAFPEAMWWQRSGEPLMAVHSRIEDYRVDDDIDVTSDGYSSIRIHIPSTGPRRGERVARILLSWVQDLELQPGLITLEPVVTLEDV